MFLSPYEKIDGIVWFPRMLQKIRLLEEGHLPEDYHAYMGLGFDQRCVGFLGVEYAMVAERVRAGASDREVLDWCYKSGRHPSAEEVSVWNDFMIKRGWRDDDAPENELQAYKEKFGHGHRSDIFTYFDFFEVDEGRKP